MPKYRDPFDEALMKSSKLVGICVPPELLELCLGIIEEVHKTFQTGTNFN